VTDRVDLRSDTLTRPVPGMRRAMAEAEVGDDVYDEDPTVRALQDEVAGLFGHEAALFVPSGSMGNQICLGLHAGPGTEVVCDHEAHVVTYELGAAAALFGSTTRTATAEQAHPGWVPQWLAMVRHEGYGTVPTRCVAVEQTHNRRGGLVLDLAELDALRAGIHAVDADVALHCDGARIWNAHVATGIPLARYGALFDTLSVCLSKGLGAPIGSVIVGSADTIERARVLRKRLGGGMRQVGVLAAAGRYALAHHLERLAEDHARARVLAARLQPWAAEPATNIVVLDLAGTGWRAKPFAVAAAVSGVGVSVTGPERCRLVTHLDVDDVGVSRAADVLARLLGDGPA
jgi:threonine aldolase